MIRFFCQTCGAKVQAPDESAGKSGWCPKCRATFVVPAASAAELAQTMSPSLTDDIPPIPVPAGQRPMAPEQAPEITTPSSRPASPFEVFGAPGSTPPPQAAEASQQAPVEGTSLMESLMPSAATRAANAAKAANGHPEFDMDAPEPFPPVTAKTLWPLILGGAGALMVLGAIVVVLMGRKAPESVATDANGAPRQEAPPPPKPKAYSEPRVIQPKPSPEAIIERTKQPTTAAKPVDSARQHLVRLSCSDDVGTSPCGSRSYS